MILGITGTIGAGKGAVVEYLENKKGFKHISARDIWTLELEARNISVNRDNMTELANKLRAENGPAYFVERALKEVGDNESTVIESIRTVGEVELLKNQFGFLLAVNANQKIRYQRVSNRGSNLDDVTFEDFVRQEDVEMKNDDPNKQNIATVMEMADYTILNEGTLEELHQKIDEILKKIEETEK